MNRPKVIEDFMNGGMFRPVSPETANAIHAHILALEAEIVQLKANNETLSNYAQSLSTRMRRR